VHQNDNEAMQCYRMAADQGLADAQISVGLVHDKGQGVDQNNEEAVKVVRRNLGKAVA
jgi:hypothetical protein